jgi:formate-dependent nitrite reductase cytochrome c552 subunit
LLTGTLTGTWRWNDCGDATFGSRRSGKPLLENARVEAERLAGNVERRFRLLG